MRPQGMAMAAAGAQAALALTGPQTIISGVIGTIAGLGKGWTEHQSPEGRKFYYHAERDESSWSKPKEVQSAEQRAFEEETNWREFRIWDGRKFFHNIESKVSCWVPPLEVTIIIERVNPAAVGNDLLQASLIKRIETKESSDEEPSVSEAEESEPEPKDSEEEPVIQDAASGDDAEGELDAEERNVAKAERRAKRKEEWLQRKEEKEEAQRARRAERKAAKDMRRELRRAEKERARLEKELKEEMEKAKQLEKEKERKTLQLADGTAESDKEEEPEDKDKTALVPVGFEEGEVLASNRVVLPTLPKTEREKRNLYAALLRDKKVDKEWTFAQVDTAFKNETNGSVVSVPVRKQVFAEHLMALRKAKLVAQQKDQMRAQALMHEELLAWEGMDLAMSYDDLAKSSFPDTSKVWRYLITSQRQEVFTRAMEEFLVKSNKKACDNQRTAIPALQILFNTRADIRPEMRFDEIKHILRDEPVLKKLKPLELLRVWKAYQTLNVVTEKEEQRKPQEEREARKTREKFLLLLNEFRAANATGESWPEFEPKVADYREYQDLLQLGRGSTPECLYHYSELDQQRKRPRFEDEAA